MIVGGCFRLVDWLDEYHSGSFRQPQVSFASRIPNAIPVADAMTMSPHLLLYCNYGKLDLKAALKETDSKPAADSDKSQPGGGGARYSANAMGKGSPGQSDNTLIPNLLMLSKHRNGSLNLWQVGCADKSKFSSVLSIAHASRACGHRFHTNSATCHPVLPLLLTTSHHNTPDDGASDAPVSSQQWQPSSPRRAFSQNRKSSRVSDASSGGGFVSELILWRVDPVGPLSKSGGVSELARVDSPCPAAFAHVAWLPTLLPR